jgi:hypothetical protein
MENARKRIRVKAENVRSVDRETVSLILKMACTLLASFSRKFNPLSLMRRFSYCPEKVVECPYFRCGGLISPVTRENM